MLFNSEEDLNPWEWQF